MHTGSTGTPGFAAPELLTAGKLTKAADIYSLALISEPSAAPVLLPLLPLLLGWCSCQRSLQPQAAWPWAMPVCQDQFTSWQLGNEFRPSLSRRSALSAVWSLVARASPHAGSNPLSIIYLVAHQRFRPTIPEGCPAGLAGLMQRCWAHEAAERCVTRGAGCACVGGEGTGGTVLLTTQAQHGLRVGVLCLALFVFSQPRRPSMLQLCACRSMSAGPPQPRWSVSFVRCCGRMPGALPPRPHHQGKP